ncbi:hypothetical protein EWI61_03320 [Methylolobus aquaticus]|nr:hypothetical protein EWI61_03320 [Methylolobus aquaticus]
MTHHKTLALTLGSALAASFATAPIANAADNPFTLKSIDGMQQVAEVAKKAKEGKCGEGKCGANKKKDGGCSGRKMKEGGCNADKMKEGGCNSSKMPEGGCSGSL